MLRNFKRILDICLIAVLILSCKEDKKKVHLVVSDHNPSGSTPALMLDLWVETVADRSEGRIEFEVHHDAEILSGEKVFNGVQKGRVDIGFYALDAVDGFKLNTAISLPFMGWPGPLEAAALYDELLDQFPEMQDEWGSLTILAMSVMPGTHMHFTDLDITRPSDLKGVRVMSSHVMTSDAVEAAGAIPVELDISEMETALESRTIDGIINHFPVLETFGVLRMMDYHLVFGDGGINMTPLFILMNKSILNNLDDDLQKILMGAGDVFREANLEISAAEDEEAREKVLEAGLTITELSASEIEEWRESIAQTVYDEWIAAAEADGLPGQEVYDAVWSSLYAGSGSDGSVDDGGVDDGGVPEE